MNSKYKDEEQKSNLIVSACLVVGFPLATLLALLAVFNNVSDMVWKTP